MALCLRPLQPGAALQGTVSTVIPIACASHEANDTSSFIEEVAGGNPTDLQLPSPPGFGIEQHRKGKPIGRNERGNHGFPLVSVAMATIARPLAL